MYTPPRTERQPTKALTPISGLRALANIPPPSKRRAPPPRLDLDSKLCGTGHPLDPYHVRGVAPKDQPAAYRVRPPVHRPIPMGINKTKFEREEEYAADPSKLELDPVNACRTCMAKGYRCFVEADPTIRERWRCWMCTHACTVAAGRMHLFGSTRGRKNTSSKRAFRTAVTPRSAVTPYPVTPGLSLSSPMQSMSLAAHTPDTPPCSAVSPSSGPLSPTDAHIITLTASLAATDALSSQLERQLDSLITARAETAQLGAAADALGLPLTPGSELGRDLDALGITPSRKYFFAPASPPNRKRYWH